MDFNNDDISGQARNRSSVTDSSPQRKVSNTMGIDNPYIASVIKNQPEVREALVGEPAVKEIKTVVREGTTITEEYERLNPDGTVTKAVSVGDRRDGMKHFGVYKMDKSGIVRRIDNGEPISTRVPIDSIPDDEWVNEMERMVAEHRERDERRKQQREAEQKAQNNTFADFPSKNSGVSEEEKREIVDEFKQNLIRYGSKRLVNLLSRKLNGEKFNNKFSLSDEQKEELIKYGIKKLGNLLLNNLDDNRILHEIENRKSMSQNQSDGNEQTTQQSKSRPVSFKFQHTDEEQENEKQLESFGNNSKPVAFKIRPEKERKMSSKHLSSQSYDDFRDSLLFPEEDYESSRKDKRNNRIKALEQLEESVAKTAKALKKLVKESEDKSKSEKQKKEEMIDRTFEQLMGVLSDSRKKYDETPQKKEKRKLISFLDKNKRNGKSSRWKLKGKSSKNFDDDDDNDDDDDDDDDEDDDENYDDENYDDENYDDENYDDDDDDDYYYNNEDYDVDEDDTLFDMDRKSLKKLLKKKDNSGTLKEGCKPSRKHQLESRDGAYARYQNNVEEQKKEKPLDKTYSSFQERPKEESQGTRSFENDSQDNKTNPQWDLSSLISQIFQKETKKPEQGPTPPKSVEQKALNFDSLLSGIKDIMSGAQTQQRNTDVNDNISTNNVYQARPQVEEKPKMEPAQPQSETKPFDFSSLVSTIKDCFSKGLENKSPPGKESSDTHFYQTRPLELNKNAQTSQGKERTLVDVDSVLGRIHQAMAPKSTAGTASTASAQQNSRPVSNTAYRIFRPQAGAKTTVSSSSPHVRYENKSTSQVRQENNSSSQDRSENISNSQVRQEKSSSFRQNGLNNDSISFTIRPQNPVKPQVESQHSLGNRTFNAENSHSANEGSSPWWFSKSAEPDFFSQTTLNGPKNMNSNIKGSVVEDPLLGSSIFNDSLLNGKSMFSNEQLPKF